MNKLFTADYTDEALEQLRVLQDKEYRKITIAISMFELVGIAYRGLNSLGNGLYEIKSDNIRAYFKYAKNRIIIIGLIVLKKSQKAPKKYIEQASRNIEKYLQNNKEL